MEHREGSKKSKVHAVFNKSGKDAAIKKAKELKLKETTARTWCSQFANDNGKPAKKKAAAPAKKAPAKKAPAKKKASREKLAA